MYRKYIKRILDLGLALLLLVPVCLISFVIGCFIKLEDSGPVFYKGARLGKNRKPYKMYKLRSMKINAPDIRNSDGSTYNSIDDPRLLKIGNFIRKSSLDELPQIFNVLKGEMSLIGPRPDLEEQGYLYDELGKDQTKFSIKPGVTGYAQCKGRNEISWDEKLKLDHYYVDNCCFILDVKIFFLTIFNVIKRKGINKDE